MVGKQVGERLLHLMADRKQKGRTDQGPGITFRGTPSKISFLQLGPTY
jgi:hypothetical protein